MTKSPLLFALAAILTLLSSCTPFKPGAQQPTAAVPATTPAAPATTTSAPAANPGGPVLRSIRIEPYIRGINQPVDIAYSPDSTGRMFVLERPGKIRVIKNNQLAGSPFLDLTPLIGSSGQEQGLLGLAFHPKFRENGFFYVNYTDSKGNTVVARYKASPGSDQADGNSASVVFRQDQPYPNHNGGHLAFGPDGYLYLGLGDGGSANDPQGNGQNLGTFLGKLLRIDVDAAAPYGIPATNPFKDRQGAKPEVWAFGLRNPWRFGFDRATGDLYIADVGQDSWEEVDFQPANSKGGENYGWNRMEGLHCFKPKDNCDKNGITLPIAEQENPREGCSVTGGYVYRGRADLPMVGYYIYSDYCSGTFWALKRDAQGAWQKTKVADGPKSISAFGEDEAGELYVASLSEGIVYRIRAAG